MKKILVKDLLGKSIKELVALRNKMRQSLYDMRLSNTLRALNQTHLIKVARRNIARINTVMTQKSQAAALKISK